MKIGDIFVGFRANSFISGGQDEFARRANDFIAWPATGRRRGPGRLSAWSRGSS
jgi:hypothetical protein